MKNEEKQTLLRGLPSVNELLVCEALAPLSKKFGRDILKYAIQNIIKETRKMILDSNHLESPKNLIQRIDTRVHSIVEGSLKRVINATGIILHTNLGRAPLGTAVMSEISTVLTGYSNLEFDLKTGRRGNRNGHLKEMLRFLTGAEDSLVVNNNAAALLLILSTFAKGKEVIVSRGELVEIGGSFRIPDILSQSGTKMVEVGTTNRTRLSDYENAITENTAFILKIHKSNYEIKGFTEEVSTQELSKLSHRRGLKLLYDQGSGFLRKSDSTLPLQQEPDVQSALQDGCDLVAFSGDKLLGGAQAGIVTGSKEMISRLEKAPLFRALRVDKLIYAALHAVLKQYLGGEASEKVPQLFQMMKAPLSELKKRGEKLAEQLSSQLIQTKVVESFGQYGGGTMPDHKISSFAVEIISKENRDTSRSTFIERLHKNLLSPSLPVISILREGRLLLDVLAIQDSEIPLIVQSVNEALHFEHH